MSEEIEYEEIERRGRRTSGRRQTNEAVLPRGEYMYTRDTTSGVTSVRCGPTVVNAQAQDEPVTYNPKTQRFETVPLSDAAQVNTVIPTGHYAVLTNPREDSKVPEAGTKQADAELLIGKREHIPGPASFALWPRQEVKVIEGHQLRSNQYLIVRVYDEEAARNNWTDAVIKKQTTAVDDGNEGQEGSEGEGVEGVEVLSVTGEIPEDLSVGRLLVIRGTEVSFYIPPTGVEVVQEDDGGYVRDALTLERLQYCILIDESGNKRYVRGPDVVFPLPTETFFKNKGRDRIFRPVELNGSIQGLHVKVIADYTDDDGVHGPKDASYNEGDELFITGETTPIYFPCEQHSVVKYDGKTKHYATAIPAGDARYVLHRYTGEIKKIEGGKNGTMYLPDPREEVFVRRVLTDAESETMYPGNPEVVEYNRMLREIQAKAPSTRKGSVSEGDLRHSFMRKGKGRRAERGGSTRGALENAGVGMNVGEAVFADATYSALNVSAEMGGDEFTRAASYTEPRTVTLGNDKFAGVPKINPWTGYAVMVVDTAGKRRVEHGPGRVLLNFNETLETLALSTGTPKNTDYLLKTAYLQTKHNKVSDIFTADTADHVSVNIKVALRVNFTGDDPTAWFSVSNYVKLLTDHVRSVVKAAVRKVKVEEFWRESEGFIRNTILGAKPEDGGKRAGMFFEENGMHVYDVEVLSVNIGDTQIQTLLRHAQHEAVESSIEIARNERRLDSTRRQEELQRQELEARNETSKFRSELETQTIAQQLEVAMAKIAATIERSQRELEKQKHVDAIEAARTEADISREQARADSALGIFKAKEEARIEALKQETAATVSKLKAVQPGFSEALLALGNQETLVKVAEAMSVQQFVGGKDLPDVIQKVFAGTPLEKLSEVMLERAATQALPSPKKPNGSRSRKKTADAS